MRLTLDQRPDLRPFFGELSAAENDRLLNGLGVVDAAVVALAEYASRYVGVPYEAVKVGFHLRDDGSAAGFTCGPSGDAGDIWFDVGVADESQTRDPRTGSPLGPPWCLDSRIFVFCTDSPERGMSNCHSLVRLEAIAHDPANVVDLLASHVATLRTELAQYSREVLTLSTHAQLLDLEAKARRSGCRTSR